MGSIFSPCLAVAWLLTSRLALKDGNCESVLRHSVVREEDLEAAFASRSGSGPAAGERRRPACLERILQGLSALEVI